MNIKNLLFIPKNTKKGVTNNMNIIFSNSKIEFKSLKISFIEGSIKKMRNGYKINITPIIGIIKIKRLLKIFLSVKRLFDLFKKLNTELDKSVIIIV